MVCSRLERMEACAHLNTVHALQLCLGRHGRPFPCTAIAPDPFPFHLRAACSVWWPANRSTYLQRSRLCWQQHAKTTAKRSVRSCSLSPISLAAFFSVEPCVGEHLDLAPQIRSFTLRIGWLRSVPARCHRIMMSANRHNGLLLRANRHTGLWQFELCGIFRWFARVESEHNQMHEIHA